MGHKNPDCVSGKLSVFNGNPSAPSKKLTAMNFCMSWLLFLTETILTSMNCPSPKNVILEYLGLFLATPLQQIEVRITEEVVGTVGPVLMDISSGRVVFLLSLHIMVSAVASGDTRGLFTRITVGSLSCNSE